MKHQKIFILWLLALATFFVFTNGVTAGGFPNISIKELKAKLDAGEKLLLLNPLSDIEFNEGHIPGSVNIPLHTINTTDRLPQDKGTLIVPYCLGPK